MRGKSIALAVAVAFGFMGCGPPEPPEEVPVLTPEPAGAPSALAQGRLTCLGNNEAPIPAGSNLTLPGWVRTFADRTNTSGVQPSARADVINPEGVSLGVAFSDSANGRVAVTVPIPMTGFTGHVLVTSDGFQDVNLYSSRPYATTGYAAWVFLLTQAELDTAATEAAETLDPSLGVLVGSVHDCDIFGIENAVVRVANDTAAVVYFDDFALAPERTFTDASGRFAVANVEPGSVTVEAFGRIEEGGPLLLLSRADITVVGGAMTAVDLQPRVGATR